MHLPALAAAPAAPRPRPMHRDRAARPARR